MANQYEIEIKCLLGSKECADELKKKMISLDPDALLISSGSQLNHYFIGPSLNALPRAVMHLIAQPAMRALQEIAACAKDFSLRTRDTDGKTILVIKASVDDTTSANGIARREFEAVIPGLTIHTLDEILLTTGYSYQSKWSREREEYKFRGATLTIDKNAGYGYIAELEKIVNDPAQIKEAEVELRKLIKNLNLEELPQDRLERMFAHYNTRWPEYYGTDRVFTIS
jgi:predicted adenylyl cyclase CyaB